MLKANDPKVQDVRRSWARRGVVRLRRDDRGATALLFGLLLLPMLGAIGLAIDFGNIMTARTKAQMAADAASLVGVGVARDDIMSGHPVQTALADAKKRAEDLFRANAVQFGLIADDVTVTVTITDNTLQATTSFSVTTPTFVSQVFGRRSIEARGSTIAYSTLPTYTDAHLVLDISPSMGIGATRAEMARLYNAKIRYTNGTFAPTGCVFGCHTVTTWNGQAEATDAVAVRNNIRLRIDVLRDAVSAAITSAFSNTIGENFFRLSLNLMGTDTPKSVSRLHALSNNRSSLQLAAATIDMSSGAYNKVSYLNDSLAEFSRTLTAAGDGKSRNAARTYVIIVTDGVVTLPYMSTKDCKQDKRGTPDYYCTVDPEVCSTIKSKKATVVVIYTTALKIYDNPAATSGTLESNYAASTAMIVDKVAPALRDCASPNWFFEASEAAEIQASLDKVFATITSGPTLGN